MSGITWKRGGKLLRVQQIGLRHPTEVHACACRDAMGRKQADAPSQGEEGMRNDGEEAVKQRRLRKRVKKEGDEAFAAMLAEGASSSESSDQSDESDTPVSGQRHRGKRRQKHGREQTVTGSKQAKGRGAARRKKRSMESSDEETSDSSDEDVAGYGQASMVDAEGASGRSPAGGTRSASRGRAGRAEQASRSKKEVDSDEGEPCVLDASGRRIVHKSPAEFFSDNKNIAGFDNPGKSLYTTIRELVENSLDATEERRYLPNIIVSVTEMSTNDLRAARGIGAVKRTNMALYAVERSKRRGKGGRKCVGSNAGDADAVRGDQDGGVADRTAAGRAVAAPQTPIGNDVGADADSGAGGVAGVDVFACEEPSATGVAGEQVGAHGTNAGDAPSSRTPVATPAAKSASGKPERKGRGSQNMFYRVCVEDNGGGLPYNAIPQLLGRVLVSTKYGLQQARGKFGLGAKMALVWARMSTGLPFEIYSSVGPTEPISHYLLDINIQKNRPRVHVAEKLPNEDGWYVASCEYCCATVVGCCTCAVVCVIFLCVAVFV